MTLPTIPDTHHVYVGADMQPLHLYTLEQMLQFRADTIEACAGVCELLTADEIRELLK